MTTPHTIHLTDDSEGIEIAKSGAPQPGAEMLAWLKRECRAAWRPTRAISATLSRTGEYSARAVHSPPCLRTGLAQKFGRLPLGAYWKVIMFPVLRMGVFAACLTAIFSIVSGAEADPRDQALRAMEDMAFKVKQGDGATVTTRMTSVGGITKDPIETRYTYTVSKILEQNDQRGPGYIVDMKMLDVKKPGSATPADAQDLFLAMIPPVKLRLDANFHPVEVLNAQEVSAQQKRALAEFKKVDQEKKKAMVLALMMLVATPESMLDNLKPISEMQGRKWIARDGAFEFTVKRGGFIPMEGIRRVVPVQVRDDEISLTSEIKFDTSPLLKQMARVWEMMNKMRREKGQPELELTMQATSKGEAILDRQTGWLRKSREVLTVSTPGSKTDRAEIVEIEQLRH